MYVLKPKFKLIYINLYIIYISLFTIVRFWTGFHNICMYNCMLLLLPDPDIRRWGQDGCCEN